ncbi:MAG: peptide ABC transporter substrate-binding protein [Chloroflexi bacterium]|nr:peptide ABC transporter substrate-binding protein [Chloroflexota bacterium]
MTGVPADFVSRGTRVCVIVILSSLTLVASAVAQVQVPAGGQPTRGGTLRVGFLGEPATLNPYVTSNGEWNTLSEPVLDGLARGAPNGSFIPILAAEVPTQANGDVSSDGTVVTWKLKSGVVWSDGQPFTSQDVVFTYGMIMDPANPVVNRSDYAVMDSVAASDDHTVVITYKRLYAPYRLAFPWIFPSHVFNGQTDLSQDPFNRAETVGTGPFVGKAWVAGQSLTLDRNPRYREPGKPFLDQVVYTFLPSRDAEVQALAAGDVDAANFLDATDLRALAVLPDVVVDPAPDGLMELLLNSSCPGGSRQGDATCPHPILGEVRVRQAIELAIDKQALVHGLLADEISPTGSILPTGPYAVDLPSEFNPGKARQLLDQAGWVIGADGIRSKGDLRAHLTVFTAIGNTLNLQTAQLIERDLRAVGIETDSKEVPTLAGGFAGQSPLSLGTFDLAVFSRTITIDPQASLVSQFASDQVPNAQLQTGGNWGRVRDPIIDQALTAAGNTLDDTERQAAYVSLSEAVRGDEALIPLYSLPVVDARATYVHGWQTNINDDVSWNIEDWWVAR